jgi:hypothetical protein
MDEAIVMSRVQQASVDARMKKKHGDNLLSLGHRAEKWLLELGVTGSYIVERLMMDAASSETTYYAWCLQAMLEFEALGRKASPYQPWDTVGVEMDGDGRADVIVPGADRTSGGILDMLQVGAPSMEQIYAVDSTTDDVLLQSLVGHPEDAKTLMSAALGVATEDAALWRVPLRSGYGQLFHDGPVDLPDCPARSQLEDAMEDIRYKLARVQQTTFEAVHALSKQGLHL